MYESIGNVIVLISDIIISLISIGIVIFCATKQIKEQELKGLEKIKVILISLYFGIMFNLLIFTPSILMIMFFFSTVLLIFGISNLKENKYIYSAYSFIFQGIILLLIIILGILNIDISRNLFITLLILIGILFYLTPYLGYLDEKKELITKIEQCINEVDAKIIKIQKGYDKETGTVYIPKLEFKINNKTHKFMDSSYIYFKDKKLYSVGDTIKILVCSNPKNNHYGRYDVLIPTFDFNKETKYEKNIKFFYKITIILFLLIIILRKYFS